MNRRDLVDYYLYARSWILQSEFSSDIERYKDSTQRTISESVFLQEYAWVVLNSGFRERVVRKYFDYISLCFCDWESAAEIHANSEACVLSAEAVFRNRRKLMAIVRTADRIAYLGFDQLHMNIIQNPIEALLDLPFLGNVTARHLAKNLGEDIAKPDRHLVRLAQRFGYTNVDAMCRDIRDDVGDAVALADLVLWRFQEQRSRSSLE